MERNLALCNILEKWDGGEVGRRFKREGTCAYLSMIHIVVWQKSTHCKAITLQLKIKNKIK